jgi:hypothetical protein
MGKSRGGLSTKIHVAVDALGNPVRLLLTPGQASEYGQGEALIEGFAFEAVLADRVMTQTLLLRLSSVVALRRSSPQKRTA